MGGRGAGRRKGRERRREREKARSQGGQETQLPNLLGEQPEPCHIPGNSQPPWGSLASGPFLAGNHLLVDLQAVHLR